MRILGVHLQGLRRPSGVHRLLLDSGYSVLCTGDAESAALLEQMILSLIYPRTDLDDYAGWRDADGDEPSRMGLSMSFGADAYRLIVDLEKERLVLGKYDAGIKDFERISTNRVGVEAHLKGIGLPSRDDFVQLTLASECLRRGLGGSIAAVKPTLESAKPVAPLVETHVESERARLTEELASAEEAEGDLEKIEARAAELREARDRFERLERDYKRVVAELEEREVMRDSIDTLDVKIAEFRDLCEERSSERAEIEHARRDFLEDRTQLRSIPAPLIFPLGLGLALGVCGTIVGLLGQKIFYALAAIGLTVSALAFLVARRARWRLGSVEARLAALRVRERSVERKFETETTLIRGLMQQLDLESIESLEREVRSYRALLDRANDLKRKLGEIRLVFTEQSAAELQHLDRRISESRQSDASPGQIRSELSHLGQSTAPIADEADDDDATPVPLPDMIHDENDVVIEGPVAPDLLIQAAASATQRTESDLRSKIGPSLSLYLRALTHGEWIQGRRDESGIWYFRRDDKVEAAFHQLPADQRSAAALAFRFALVESLAEDFSVPVLVGTDLPVQNERDRDTLARALQRLSSVAQIIQITDNAAAWEPYAGLVIDLGKEGVPN